MTKAKKQEKNRPFTLTVKAEKAEELKKEIMSHGHNFKELTDTSKSHGGNYIFFEVDFKNSSEKNALCNFCDFLNGFRDSSD